MTDMVRQRRTEPQVHDDPDGSGTLGDARRTRSEQIDRTFTRGLIPVALLAGALVVAGFWNKLPDPSSNKEYAVVLDAGSTGSRVLGFTFERDPDSKSLRLLDELWMQVLCYSIFKHFDLIVINDCVGYFSGQTWPFCLC